MLFYSLLLDSPIVNKNDPVFYLLEDIIFFMYTFNKISVIDHRRQRRELENNGFSFERLKTDEQVLESYRNYLQ